MWFIIAIIVIIFFVKMDSIIEILRSKDPKFHAEKMKKEELALKEKQEMKNEIKNNIGKMVKIQSLELIYINDKYEMIGKILDADDDWMEIEYEQRFFIKDSIKKKLIIRIDCIESISVLVENDFSK